MSATLVARHYPIVNQKSAGPGVIGDHAQIHILLRICAIAGTGDLGGAVEEDPAGVNLVDIVHTLEERSHPFQAHAGVDVLGRQIAKDRVILFGGSLSPLILHEDQVPHFEVAVLIYDRTTLATEVRTTVVVDLRARTAGARHAHRPVIVRLATPLNPLSWHSHVTTPNLCCFVVVVVDRHPNPVRIESVTTIGLRVSQQLPGERNRPGFEIVPEGEVARHLEKRGMPGSFADLLDIERADALLN